MTASELNGFLDIASKITLTIALIIALVFVLVGGKRKWWVFGWVYEAKERESQEYKSIMYELLRVTEKNVEVTASRIQPSIRTRFIETEKLP